MCLLARAQFKCLPYISFDLRSGAKLYTISRVYEKIFATIAEIGGFTELTIIMFGLLYLLYNQHFYHKFMKR